MNQKAILRILLEASVLPDLLRHGSSLVILSRAQNPCRDNKVFLRWLLTFFLWTLLIISTAHAQQVDSILNRVYPDKLINIEADTLLANIKKADSVTRAFQSGVDSVFQDFRKQISYINSTRNKLQNKIDSLNNLQLPIQKFTKKLDSLNHLKNEKLKAATTKINNLKSKATKSLDAIQLPTELQGPVNNLKRTIDNLSLPEINSVDLTFGNIELSNLSNLQLPTLTDQIKLDPNLINYSGELSKLNGLGKELGTYAQDVKQLTHGNLNEIKSVDKLIENKIAGLEGMEQLQEGRAIMDKAKPDSAALASMAKEQILNAAQDHFAGKEVVLQQAMDKMSKLKSKYSEVKSLAELPKRLPNPLKGKPFLERLIPGISFQVQKSQFFLLDVNPSVLYKIRPRLAAGAGWNERLPFDGWKIQGGNERVFGPRMVIQFLWIKGINFRLQPEWMNTTIPPVLASSLGLDPSYRKWITSIFAGIKKEFTVYKSIRGNSELLYNFRDKDGMSPYSDKVTVRFGFEFTMKKQESKPARRRVNGRGK